MNNDHLKNILKKIRGCANFDTLYGLEEDFNNVGLTVQPTNQSRMLLCRIEESKPITGKVLDDYIFIGSIKNREDGLSMRDIDCITSFIIEHAGSPAEVVGKGRKWQQQTRMYAHAIDLSDIYGSPIGTGRDESVEEVVQQIEHDKEPVSDDIELISQHMGSKKERRLVGLDVEQEKARIKAVNALASYLDGDGDPVDKAG